MSVFSVVGSRFVRCLILVDGVFILMDWFFYIGNRGVARGRQRGTEPPRRQTINKRRKTRFEIYIKNYIYFNDKLLISIFLYLKMGGRCPLYNFSCGIQYSRRERELRKNIGKLF